VSCLAVQVSLILDLNVDHGSPVDN
jgi:hypothetical protein